MTHSSMDTRPTLCCKTDRIVSLATLILAGGGVWSGCWVRPHKSRPNREKKNRHWLWQVMQSPYSSMSIHTRWPMQLLKLTETVDHMTSVRGLSTAFTHELFIDAFSLRPLVFMTENVTCWCSYLKQRNKNVLKNGCTGAFKWWQRPRPNNM